MSNTIDSTSGTSGTGTTGASSTQSGNQLGKNEFLKLLLAQLQNQDPLSPVDNQQFIAQLAQFSSLEQLQNISGRLDSLITAQATSTDVSASLLVGSAVVFKSSTLSLDGTNGAQMEVELPSAAKSVNAVITDSSGKVVRTLSSGAAPAGSLALNWDGKDQNGQALPAGLYTVTVTATGEDGQALTVEERAAGVVTGVDLSSGSPELLVGQNEVALSDVIQIVRN